MYGDGALRAQAEAVLRPPAAVAAALFKIHTQNSHMLPPGMAISCGNITAAAAHLQCWHGPWQVTLDLSQNKLTGAMPDILGGMVDLQNLDISANSLTGEWAPRAALLRLRHSNSLHRNPMHHSPLVPLMTSSWKMTAAVAVHLHCCHGPASGLAGFCLKHTDRPFCDRAVPGPIPPSVCAHLGTFMRPGGCKLDLDYFYATNNFSCPLPCAKELLFTPTGPCTSIARHTCADASSPPGA